MLNLDKVSRETKDGISGILWFFALVPLAMLMHWLAHTQVRIEYTIMGWLLATLGALQLGFGLGRAGKKLFRIPIPIMSKSNQESAKN